MIDYIVILLILISLILAIRYMHNQKKNGVKCIGCPYAKNCSKKSCN